MDEPPVLELRGITKEFPGVLANDHVDFDLRRGEVHALLGENGAGKSTLMSILYGLYTPDSGEILMNGKPVSIHSPKNAIELGIGMVHQHFMLIPVMTVTENIVLANEPVHAGFLLTSQRPRSVCAEVARTFNFAIDPHARIQDITVGQQQRVEIMKALYRNADLVILDEPTAVLTPQEAAELFEILKTLTREGISIIFITHKLNEVLEIADRITVLRRGKKVETIPREGATEAGLARAMVGREVLLRVDKKPGRPGEPLLKVADLSVLDDRGLEAVRDVTFDVRAGEIVGIAGVYGNGQSELIDALTGLRKVARGQISVGGEDLTHASARQALDAGMGHIPETAAARPCPRLQSGREPRVARLRQGTVFAVRLAEPQALAQVGRRLAQGVRRPRWRSGDTRRLLVGGNQQKVVIAREVSRDPSVLVAAQPTRGLDVGAIEFVHRRLVEQRDAGKAVLLVSLELEEIVSLSDRILVLYEGRIVAEFPPEVSEEELGLATLGAGRQEDAAA